MNPLKFLRQWVCPDRTAGTISERLLADRIVLIETPIDDTSAAETIAKLLFLQDQNPESPITLYIDSPGGYVTAGLAILDTMDDSTGTGTAQGRVDYDIPQDQHRDGLIMTFRRSLTGW